MCGKFTQKKTWPALVQLADSLLAEEAEAAADAVSVTPMRFAEVVVWEEGALQRRPMRWGWARRGAETPGNVPHHIHARAESIDTLPTFADAFALRRGLLLVDSFNEGEEITPKKTRQYRITPNKGGVIGIAVLFERWQHESDGALDTFVMVTTPPNALIGTITDRMPAVLQPEAWPVWLGQEAASLAAIKTLLVPVEGDWSMAPQKKEPPPRQAELF